MKNRKSTLRAADRAKSLFLPLAALLLVLTLLLAACETLWACAAAPRKGDYVGIANETALIIWDAESETQHFIRRATFDTKAKDFGFLVPTPSKPELDEAHDYTFKLLANITAPQHTTKLLVKKAQEHGTSQAKGPSMNGVQVLETKRVGGYDAVVLQADDAKELSKWLEKHGYATDAALTDWLTSYVKKQWFLTAFKITREAEGQTTAAASAVRMSFSTKKPFFPYREPANQRDPSKPVSSQRLLRVFVLAGSRMEGTLGEGGAYWPGQTVWSGGMNKDLNDFLLYSLKTHDKVKGKNWWLTEFEDTSSPRPGTDEVYFAAAADQSPVSRPPIVSYLVHYEKATLLDPALAFSLGVFGGAVVVAVVGFLFGGLLRQKKAP